MDMVFSPWANRQQELPVLLIRPHLIPMPSMVFWLGP